MTEQFCNYVTQCYCILYSPMDTSVGSLLKSSISNISNFSFFQAISKELFDILRNVLNRLLAES